MMQSLVGDHQKIWAETFLANQNLTLDCKTR